MQILIFNKNKVYAITCFLALMLTETKAQIEKFEKEKYTIYIEEKDIRIKANVLAHKTKIKPQKELLYSWYASNKIIETQGGYDGKLLHGDYAIFYQNNTNLKEKGKFRNGLKNGEWIAWRENGKIATIIHWKKGRLNGKYSIYDAQGNLGSQKMYKKGKETALKDTLLERIKQLLKKGNKEKKKKPILAT